MQTPNTEPNWKRYLSLFLASIVASLLVLMTKAEFRLRALWQCIVKFSTCIHRTSSRKDKK